MLWVKHLSPAGSQPKCPPPSSSPSHSPPPPANPAAPLPTSAQDPSRDRGDGLCRSLASELGNGRWMFLRKACWKFSRGLDDHLPIRSKWSPSNILCRYWDSNICSLGRHGCELPGMSWQKKAEVIAVFVNSHLLHTETVKCWIPENSKPTEVTVGSGLYAY